MTFYGSNPLETVGANSGLLVTCIVQSAYRDSLCMAMEENRSLDPAKSILISLHDKIRALIPRRLDLHDQLSDHIRERKRKGVLLRIITAAQALEQLESEARAETTNEWILEAQRWVDEGFDSSMTNISESTSGSGYLEISNSFLITSLLYLLFKAELCDQDKKDYYLHIRCKDIMRNGVQLEQMQFVKMFGALSIDSAPNTLKWIDAMVENASPEIVAKLKHSRDERHDFIFGGWINEIIFSGAHVILPEVLIHDLGGLKGIRDVTRIAAAGSALALHACNTAGKPVSVLEYPDDDAIYRARAAMVLAMSERLGKNSSDYEASVATHVVALAKLWNSNLEANAVDMLRNRTLKVLRGEDAVIQVLEGRVKTAFGEIVVKESRRILCPISMKTGKNDGMDVSLHTEESRESVRVVFHKYGMAFYASDLALAASKAFKIIDLAWRVFGDALLEPMMLQVLKDK
jgi:hypothetical protein